MEKMRPLCEMRENSIMKALRNSGLILVLGLTLIILNVGNVSATVLPPDASSWFVDMKRFSTSAHGTFSCETCHDTMKDGNKKHPDPEDAESLKKEATRTYDYGRCKSCHRQSYERYLLGEHAKALGEEQKRPAQGEGAKSESRKAPTCGHCHSAHYSESHLSRMETGREMTEVCSSCHQAQMITYLEDYHGKTAVNLGHTASAYCTDCHGAHNCISLKDKKVALAACQRCHPQAQEKFAEFVIHPTIKDLTEKDKDKITHVTVIKAVTAIMLIIVILVVGFFYGHSFIWLLRELHEKLRKH
jgi:hypothetical protein